MFTLFIKQYFKYSLCCFKIVKQPKNALFLFKGFG